MVGYTLSKINQETRPMTEQRIIIKGEEAMRGVRLCIHRAADAIGGNCIEIAASTGN